MPHSSNTLELLESQNGSQAVVISRLSIQFQYINACSSLESLSSLLLNCASILRIFGFSPQPMLLAGCE
jgi:hypothetical protein